MRSSWDTVGCGGSRSDLSTSGSGVSNSPNSHSRLKNGAGTSLVRGSVFSSTGPLANLLRAGSKIEDSEPLTLVHKGSGGMFANINAIRDGQRQETKKLDFYKESGCMAALAKSKPFEYLTLTVIFLNALWIGVDTDLNPGDTMETSPRIFQVFENIFCAYFTAEVIVRFCAFKRKCDMRKDYWFVFDTFLVSFMVFETWVMWAVGGNGPFSGLSILRLLRLARLTRMARLMRSIPELLTMIKGLVAALRSVSSVLLFLAIIIYVYAIVFTGSYQAVENADVEETTELLQPLFGNLGQSMLTLLLSGTLLDDLSPLVTLIRKDSIVMLLFFFSFIVLSSFTVLNMLIGILCEVVSATEAGEKHKMKVNAVKEVLTREFKKIDKDGTDTICETEFDQMLEDECALGVMAVLQKELDIHKNHLAEMKPLLFGDSNDEESSPNEISFNDFLNLLIRLRPGESAGPIDIQEFRKLLREQERAFVGRVSKLQHQVDTLRPKVRSAAGAQLQQQLTLPVSGVAGVAASATEPQGRQSGSLLQHPTPSSPSSVLPSRGNKSELLIGGSVASQAGHFGQERKTAASSQPGATGQTLAMGAAPVANTAGSGGGRVVGLPPGGAAIKAQCDDQLTSPLGEVHQEHNSFSEVSSAAPCGSGSGVSTHWEEDLRNALDSEIVEELRRRLPGWSMT